MIDALSPELLRIAGAVFLASIITALAMFVRRRRLAARALGDAPILLALLGSDLQAIPWRRLSLVAAAALALALALADPRLLGAAPPRGGSVVFLLDLSGSMLVHDTGGPRLELQRTVARELIERLPGEPVGIVAFSGRAFTLTPPTRDRGSLEMYLSALDPNIVTQSGSALGAAIRQGMGLLGGGAADSRGTLVLFSDGDETEDGDAALEAAGLARRAGATVHVVGVGTPEGGAVPALDLSTGQASGLLRDAGGDPVTSALDEALLQSIADRAGGRYFRADQARTPALVAEAIAGGDPVPDRSRDDPIPSYVWLLSGAFLLLLIEPALNSRR